MKREGESRGEIHEAMELLGSFERAGTKEDLEAAWAGIEQFFARESVNSLTMRMVMRGLEQTGKLDSGFRERFDVLTELQDEVRKARFEMSSFDESPEDKVGEHEKRGRHEESED